MPSALSWLDFAESDRQRAMQVIDLFREKGTVDELGFAPIRDSFADYLFPGTSTIQTRARYFLFLPWLMRRYEGRKFPAQQIAAKIRKRETKLIIALLAGDDKQGGIIGREALDTLKRMPSSVYWRGLHLWGIRLFSGSIDQYCRRCVKGRSAGEQSVVTDDGEPLSASSRNWHPSLPDEPPDLYERASFRLTAQEAEFLRERICSAQPASMLAQLVSRATAGLTAEFAWDKSFDAMLTPELRNAIEHARRFAMCTWGGPLVYSRMLARMKQNAGLVEKLDISLAAWQEAISREARELSEWDRAGFWSLIHRLNPRLSSRTQNFADNWIGVALRAAAGTPVWNEPVVHKLIEFREGQLKGPRARLRPENQRARDQWQGDAEGGPMDYRWGPSRTIVNDIIMGLYGEAGEETSNA